MLTSFDKAEFLVRTFYINSALDVSGASLPDFYLRIGPLLSDMLIIHSVIADIIPNLVSHKPCRPVLSKLQNKGLADFCFHACWKSSSVVPVLKNAVEPSETYNSRSVSLLFIL